MMRTLCIVCVCLVSLLAASAAEARPPREMGARWAHRRAYYGAPGHRTMGSLQWLRSSYR